MRHLYVAVLFGVFFPVISFTPLTKEEQLDRINKMQVDIEPFRKNLTECAHQTRASTEDVDHFLKRIPQSTLPGKCFVACILKRNSIITNNRVNRENLLQANKIVFGDSSAVVKQLDDAINHCLKLNDQIFEICEYASNFNDCMHLKMEHILDKELMNRRMEALGQLDDADDWDVEDDQEMQLLRDEL